MTGRAAAPASTLVVQAPAPPPSPSSSSPSSSAPPVTLSGTLFDLLADDVSLYIDAILSEYDQLLRQGVSSQAQSLADTIVSLMDAMQANPLYNRTLPL